MLKIQKQDSKSYEITFTQNKVGEYNMRPLSDFIFLTRFCQIMSKGNYFMIKLNIFRTKKKSP